MAYHQDWSQSSMKDYQLTFEEHHLNNEWFNNMLALLKPNGKLSNYQRDWLRNYIEVWDIIVNY